MPYCSLMNMGTPLFYFKIEVIKWQIFSGQSLNKNLLSLLFQRNYLKKSFRKPLRSSKAILYSPPFGPTTTISIGFLLKNVITSSSTLALGYQALINFLPRLKGFHEDRFLLNKANLCFCFLKHLAFFQPLQWSPLFFYRKRSWCQAARSFIFALFAF